MEPNAAAEEAPASNVDSASAGDASALIDANSYRMIAEINRRRSTIKLAPIAGGILGLVTLMSFAYDLQLIGLFAVILTVATTVRAAKYDKRQRTTFLHYELGAGFSQFAEKQRICQILLGSEKVWRVHAQPSAMDPKENVETGTRWSRKEVVIGRGLPSCIDTNVDIWRIDAGSLKLYFFPDYLFVLQNGKYTAVPYESLTPQVSASPFIEHSSPPGDARIVGHTWKYIRLDGGPDPRFKRNRKLPIAMYGLLTLSSSSGLNIWLQCSNQECASEAAEQIEHPKPPRPEQPKSQKYDRPKPQRPEAERKWEPPRPAKATDKSDYEMLQVSTNATDGEITAAYIRLAQMYHPDKVEGLAPEYKVIGIARMKEINDAYARLKSRQGGK